MKDRYLRIMFWLGQRWQRHSDSRLFFLVIAILIGFVSGLAAILLHKLVDFLGHVSQWSCDRLGDIAGNFAWFAFPFAGIAISFLIQKKLGGPRYAKSLAPLILALRKKQSRIPAIETFNHILSSAFSVGLGGSAGLEAPSVLTGAAIGSNIARFFRVNRRRSLLIGCGAAAGISAIFNSPIGGVLFVVEVLLPEFSVSALVPILLSSAIASVTSRIVIGNHQFFSNLSTHWLPQEIPSIVLCAIVCALVGVFSIKSTYAIDYQLDSRFPKPVHRLFVGGSILCILLALFPALRGSGYKVIELLIADDAQGLLKANSRWAWLPLGALLPMAIAAISIFTKSFASTLTIESGGDGGMFAPSMFIGACTGYAFANAANMTGLVQLPIANLVIIGMCGVFTAVMRAPLTGVILIAEVTGGYVILVPLMIVSTIAWSCANFLEPYSIYTKALAEHQNLADDNVRIQ